MKSIPAHELDEKFENGEDISEYLDWENARVGPGFEIQPALFTLPVWLLKDIDSHAEKLGLTRQALVQGWLEERLAGTSVAERHVAE